mgnify:CR=1 FL=1
MRDKKSQKVRVADRGKRRVSVRERCIYTMTNLHILGGRGSTRISIVDCKLLEREREREKEG